MQIYFEIFALTFGFCRPQNVWKPPYNSLLDRWWFEIWCLQAFSPSAHYYHTTHTHGRTQTHFLIKDLFDLIDSFHSLVGQTRNNHTLTNTLKAWHTQVRTGENKWNLNYGRYLSVCLFQWVQKCNYLNTLDPQGVIPLCSLTLQSLRLSSQTGVQVYSLFVC